METAKGKLGKSGSRLNNIPCKSVSLVGSLTQVGLFSGTLPVTAGTWVKDNQGSDMLSIAQLTWLPSRSPLSAVQRHSLLGPTQSLPLPCSCGNQTLCFTKGFPLRSLTGLKMVSRLLYLTPAHLSVSYSSTSENPPLNFWPPASLPYLTIVTIVGSHLLFSLLLRFLFFLFISLFSNKQEIEIETPKGV